MDLLNQLNLSSALHVLSESLLIPTVLCLLGLTVYAVYTLGSLVVECASERRHYRLVLPELIAKLDEAPYEELDETIAHAGVLDTQREALQELVAFMYLPPDALTEVAKRLLADEQKRYRKALSATESAVKVAPMLGLMGTLIPLGPGIVALSSGDLATLSSSLLVAFDTTVAGLSVAVICYLVTKLKRRWYEDYLVSIEGAMNTILEKADLLRSQGFEFPKRISPASGPKAGGSHVLA